MSGARPYDAGMPTTIEELSDAFRAAGRALDAYVETLPARALAMPAPYVNGRGQQVGAHPGWSVEERARVAELRAVERGLAVQLDRARAEARAAA